jgi:fatty-acyl-CoA synthase
MTGGSGGWDLAGLWHALADAQPDRPALIHGDETITWRQFDTAAAAVADTLHRQGLRRGDVAAICLPNGPAFLILFAGALRRGIVPCGINYRYRTPELVALLEHLKPGIVLHDADHDDVVAARLLLPGVPRWTALATGSPSAASGTLAAAGPDGRVYARADDVLLKCTGGTTGTPTAVRWRVGDILTQLNDHNPWNRHHLQSGTRPKPGGDARLLVASPLMHGSGLTRALGALCAGGTVVTLPGRSFNPIQILTTAQHQRVDSLAIVGDAHALPLADTLTDHPGRWPLYLLDTITSSGAAWTHSVKQRLLAALPHARLVETLGATEATGLGVSVSGADAVAPTGQFSLGRHAQVFNPDGTATQPGQTGAIGVAWPQPDGLHPGGQLPADRYIAHDGRRYLLSGDRVHLLTDRRFQFLGRDADCLNTGGEKVWAPEVAEVLTDHPAVTDAAVVGIPHPRLGTAVAALIHLHDTAATTADVLAYARTRLAGYKLPTTVVAVSAVPRTGAGKVDLAAARALAAACAHARQQAPA